MTKEQESKLELINNKNHENNKINHEIEIEIINNNNKPVVGNVEKSARNPDIITRHSTVLIQMPSGNYKLIELRKEKSTASKHLISLGKFGEFQMDALLGKYFDVPLEISEKGEKLKEIESDNFLADYEIDPTVMTCATNQELGDDRLHQKLSPEQILEMKKQGLNGNLSHKDIIESLVSNHDGFNEKTEFSKAKYIKKKVSKFSKIFVPLKPTAQNMILYHRSKDELDKIRELRSDSLSQMLAFANVRYGSQVLCVDDCGGIVAHSILERTAGNGHLICFHGSTNTSFASVTSSNLSDHAKKSLITYSWFRFHEPFVRNEVSDPIELEKQENRLKRYQEVEEIVKKGEFDTLIASTEYNPLKVLERLQPLLSPSARICFHDPRKEPLLELYKHIRASKEFCNASLTESWMRGFQVPVLASGTHPDMMTSGNGGFLLSATLVTNEGCDELRMKSMKEIKQAKRLKVNQRT